MNSPVTIPIPVITPVDGLDFEHVPVCECEFMYALFEPQTCSNPASWWGVCPGCGEAGYYCNDCKGMISGGIGDTCDSCHYVGNSRWVRL